MKVNVCGRRSKAGGQLHLLNHGSPASIAGLQTLEFSKNQLNCSVRLYWLHGIYSKEYCASYYYL